MVLKIVRWVQVLFEALSSLINTGTQVSDVATENWYIFFVTVIFPVDEEGEYAQWMKHASGIFQNQILSVANKTICVVALSCFFQTL